MPDLIPHHEPRTLETDAIGWTTWGYRGARVRGKGLTNYLHMEGHPLDGRTHGHHDAWFPIIDRWLDHGDLPKPFVWPAPKKG
jgi:hypothetical protein